MQERQKTLAQATGERATPLLDRLPDEILSHSVRVAEYSVALGAAWGLGGRRLDDLSWGALLHDVGKALLPGSVLTKPGDLNAREWRWMLKHPQLGAALVCRAGFGWAVEEMVLTHQERWDGAGYPFGLTGSEIPLSSRLLAVADTYDCLTSDRSYRSACSPWDALAELRRSADSQLQGEIVACFEDLTRSNSWLRSSFVRRA